MTDQVISVKKIRGSALLSLQGGETLRVPLSLYRERPLRAGERIDPEDYEHFMARRGYTHALDGAVKLLALRDRSEREIRQHLTQVGYPALCIDNVIEKLYAEELLDDAAFAERWAQSRAHKHGRGRIARELRQRGVDAETVADAVSVLSDEEQLRDAVRLTGKYLGRTQGDFNRQLYQRVLNMLSRHGYDASIARRALEIIANGQDEEE